MSASNSDPCVRSGGKRFPSTTSPQVSFCIPGAPHCTMMPTITAASPSRALLLCRASPSSAVRSSRSFVAAPQQASHQRRCRARCLRKSGTSPFVCQAAAPGGGDQQPGRQKSAAEGAKKTEDTTESAGKEERLHPLTAAAEAAEDALVRSYSNTPREVLAARCKSIHYVSSQISSLHCRRLS